MKSGVLLKVDILCHVTIWRVSRLLILRRRQRPTPSSLLMLSDLGCGRIRAKEMKWDCLVEIELSISVVVSGPFYFLRCRKDIALNAATTMSFAVAKSLVDAVPQFLSSPLKRSKGISSILLLNWPCPRALSSLQQSDPIRRRIRGLW